MEPLWPTGQVFECDDVTYNTTGCHLTQLRVGCVSNGIIFSLGPWLKVAHYIRNRLTFGTQSVRKRQQEMDKLSGSQTVYLFTQQFLGSHNYNEY